MQENTYQRALSPPKHPHDPEMTGDHPPRGREWHQVASREHSTWGLGHPQPRCRIAILPFQDHVKYLKDTRTGYLTWSWDYIAYPRLKW